MKCRCCDCDAVCLFCAEHRPPWMPADLERPAAGPDDDTADLRPQIEEALADDDGRSA